MTTTHRVLTTASLAIAAAIAPHKASAQFPGFVQGGQSTQHSQTNYFHQQSIHTQDPGAAIVGGLLGGIGAGLNAQNPQKHAVASHVLGGLGTGFMMASQPTFTQQGHINHVNHQTNHQYQGVAPGWQGGGMSPPGIRPANRPLNRPMGRPMGHQVYRW